MRLCFAALALVACSPSTPAPPATASAPAASPVGAAPAASALDRLEQRLLAAKTFRVHVRTASSGRIESHFEGTIVAGPDRRAQIAVQGALGNRDLSALFVSDGNHMHGGTPGSLFDLDTGPALREGLVLELVWRGILHDFALLSGGHPPDSLDGKGRQHLEVVGLARAPDEAIHGIPVETWTWELFVDHARAADESLSLDGRTGLPLRRRGTVHFPEGDMTFGEDYEVAVDEPEDAATFRIAP